MTTASNATLDEIIDLIKEVKPGIADQEIQPDQSVVEELGLDSLDLLQLSRRINRNFGADFDLDTWNADAEQHHRSVASIAAAVAAGSRA
ncbi:phosphopantetheine-binding protein [Streptomyces sp. NBC_00038]|uniref:phosphopantetheine-binding protein n=1 Tax=Streptomyces sp. NBC_00038 TaxID=2903615 RepID=UPI00224FA92D|nr:phosphopantetheine-binding protein [Streptomyces sp. NBC_00038]MCX5555809.1 L-histidine N(alpha)-methyltransferase [Streptomyces sp. NBC_00038]